MNRQAIYHANKSEYSYAVSRSEVEIRLRTARGDAESVELIYGMKYDWTIARESCAMEKKYTDDLFDYYVIRLRLQDTRLAYIFRIRAEGKEYYYSEDGVRETYDWALGYFNYFQIPYVHEADVHREVNWAREAVLYQVFVDRFYRGDERADKGYVNLEWGERPNPKSFAGGDLEGIRKKLDYLQEMGFNALYLTPIFASRSNHKYDTRDYFRVDDMFGGERALEALAKDVHSRGMRIILDAVWNHCSRENALFADVMEKGKASDYYDWFLIEGDKPDAERGNYEHFAGCTYMPKFNTSNRAVQEYLIGVSEHWMGRYGIDGWRLDVADEVSDTFWRRFREAVKGRNPNVILLAENWQNGSAWLRGDEYDGAMNYPLTKACLDYFVYDRYDARDMAERLSNLLMRNTMPANHMMLNLLDSHDTERFLTLAKKNGKDERSLINALAVLFFSYGMPCVYYGTEIGMEGGYDPDCRRTFDWDSSHWNERIRGAVKKLIGIRKTLRGEIAYGEQGGVLTIRRGNRILAINNQAKAAQVWICGHRIAIEGQTFQVINSENGGMV